jgi:hypothetical protein
MKLKKELAAIKKKRFRQQDDNYNRQMLKDKFIQRQAFREELTRNKV